ncbi:unnamed protein product [Ectocarpus sp. CCAP 1310/34]|nr:unnamed protein product [Ectocarpus sp. CCAP 1310/34]
MSGRKDGGDSSSDSAAEDRKGSREELVALRTQVSLLTDQMSQLMSLVEDIMKASKKEEPAGTMEGAADRGDARESAAAESTNAEGGAPWTGSAQDGRYLREPVRESGPSGRHSGEAGGFVPQEGALRELKTIHDPESSVQPSEDLKSLTSTKISRGEKKGAKGAEQAYFADGEGRRELYSSRSQGQGHGRGGGRGRSSSRGRGGGGRGGRSGGSGGVEESKGSSSGGADGGGGGDYKFPGRCFRCGHRGHQTIGCTNNEKDFVPWCARCKGWGHTKEKCATEEAVLAQVVEHESDVDSVEDHAFCAVAVPPGNCGTVGEVGLVGVMEQGQAMYVADTVATCSMFRCADNFVNYRVRSGWVKGIGGDKAPVPILGYGDVTLVLQTEDSGGYQIKPTLHTACAALIGSGDAKAANPTDLNEYHLAHGHAHETLLRITAEQQGVQLTDGPLLPCLAVRCPRDR